MVISQQRKTIWENPHLFTFLILHENWLDQGIIGIKDSIFIFFSRIWQCDQKPHKMNIQLLVGIYRSLCRFWGLIIPRKAQWCLVIAMRHRSFWRSFPWSSSYPYYLLLKLLQKAHQDHDLNFSEWVAQHAESGAGWIWALPKGIYQQVVAWSPWQADQIHQLWYVQHMILDEGVHWAWDADQGLHPVDYHLLGIW